MKMSLDHYHRLKDAMTPNLQYAAQYRDFIVKEGKAKDIEKRLRWDLLYNSIDSQWICENLYLYLDDTHIDTALRFIMQDYQKKAA